MKFVDEQEVTRSRDLREVNADSGAAGETRQSRETRSNSEGGPRAV
jgi:hypothetical protein